MTVDEGRGYNHRIAYLFGDGQWLLDHPTAGMADDFSVVELQIVSTLSILLRCIGASVDFPLSNKHSPSRCFA